MSSTGELSGTRAPAQRRWTMRFVDRQLERTYRDDLALQLRTQTSVVLALFLTLAIAAAPLDPRVAGSPGNADVMLLFRLAVGVPILALGLLVHWRLPVPTYLRWREPVTMGAFFGPAVFILGSSLFLPDPELAPTENAFRSWVMGQLTFMLLLGLDLVVATVTVTFATTLFVVIVAVRFPEARSNEFFDCVMGGSLGTVGAYLLDRARRQTFVANRLLAEERARADRLLENVLPTPIAERLKGGERRIAEHFDHCTVLFADLVGFTTLAERMPAAELVDKLDDVFSAFDDLAERHGLEKIKTIGDAYMVVGGVPTARPDHARAVATMALAMRAEVAARAAAGTPLAVRIGIHTGPAVAGVIGKRKFTYDLWGDTVNLASRMESHGVAGAIQISQATADALDGAFTLEPRGPVAIKGKGELSTFLLLGAAPGYES